MQNGANELFPTRQSSSGGLMFADPSAVAAAEAAKARIQSAYIMAMQRPRNEMESRNRILMACKRTEFAGKAEYSKPVGNQKIKGPSIRFAELALREWGNIMSEVQTLYEDENVRRVRVSVLDLETNAQFTKDIQLKKTIERKSKKGREGDIVNERKNSYGEKVYILRATDEEMYTKEAGWVSRVLRNEGLRLIPTDIIEEGMAEARKTIANKAYQDPEGEKKRILDAFSSLGVRPSEIERYLKHTIDTISPAEIIDLRAVYLSIKDGETSWNDYVSSSEQDAPTASTKFYDLLITEVELETVPDPDVEEFVKLTAKANGTTPDNVKLSAIEDMRGFLSAFEKWRSSCPAPKTEAPDTVPLEREPMDPEPAPKAAQATTSTDTPQDTAPDQSTESNWWDYMDDKGSYAHWVFRGRGAKKPEYDHIVRIGFGMKTAGNPSLQSDFDQVLKDNPKAFGTLKAASKEAKKAVKNKYVRIFSQEKFDALLADVNGKPVSFGPDINEPPTNGNEPETEARENSAGGMQHHPGWPENTKEWGELQELRKKHPRQYLAVVRGRTPFDIETMTRWIGAIKQVVRNEEGGADKEPSIDEQVDARMREVLQTEPAYQQLMRLKKDFPEAYATAIKRHGEPMDPDQCLQRMKQINRILDEQEGF